MLCCGEDENSIWKMLVENRLLLGLNNLGGPRSTMKKRRKSAECEKEKSGSWELRKEKKIGGTNE